MKNDIYDLIHLYCKVKKKNNISIKIINDIQISLSNNNIYMYRNENDEILSFATWEPIEDYGKTLAKLKIICFDSKYIRKILNDLIDNYFSKIGIHGYNRETQRNHTRLFRWKALTLEQIQDSTESELHMLWRIWGSDFYPGHFVNDKISVKEAVRQTRYEILSKLAPVDSGIYLECGPGNSQLAIDLAQKATCEVISVQFSAPHFVKAHEAAEDLQQIHLIHGFPIDFEINYGDFDGVIIQGLSQYIPNFTDHFKIISRKIKKGGRILLIDNMVDQKKINNTIVDWEKLFEESNLFIVESQDWTEHAIRTYIKLLKFLPKDKHGNPYHKPLSEHLKHQLFQYLDGKQTWKIWVLNKKNDNIIKRKNVNYPIINRKQTCLVMLSGGIDSVYMLWNELKNTDVNVIAHHIHFVNLERRHQAEADACKEIVQWLKKNVRDFYYSESKIDRSGMLFFGFDMVAVGYEAGIAAQNYRYLTNEPVDYWGMGACIDDKRGISDRAWQKRCSRVQNACELSSYPNNPPQYWEPTLITKAEQVAKMPEELVLRTWGCRWPRWAGNKPTPCGKCHTCQARKELGRSVIENI